VGEGIDGLFGWLVRLICDPGAVFVTSIGAYPTFNFHVTGYGGQLVRVPYRDDHEDPEALLAAARDHRAKAIYLANPDNPMGTWHPAPLIEDMVARLPETTLLVLDEAYLDLAPVGTEPKIDPDHPGVIRFRTFSKAYGMAGARVGYAITAPELAAAFDRVRNHFGVGRVVQAGAIAALQDPDHLSAVRQWAVEGRAQLSKIARDNGLAPLPSATNFVAIDCGADGDFARKVLQALVAGGTFIRMPGVAPLDRCIRVSLGDPAAIAAFAHALPLALAAARG
jgi:histidinol-phosphate aminotransferase